MIKEALNKKVEDILKSYFEKKVKKFSTEQEMDFNHDYRKIMILTKEIDILKKLKEYFQNL